MQIQYTNTGAPNEPFFTIHQNISWPSNKPNISCFGAISLPAWNFLSVPHTKQKQTKTSGLPAVLGGSFPARRHKNDNLIQVGQKAADLGGRGGGGIKGVH